MYIYKFNKPPLLAQIKKKNKKDNPCEENVSIFVLLGNMYVVESSIIYRDTHIWGWKPGGLSGMLKVFVLRVCIIVYVEIHTLPIYIYVHFRLYRCSKWAQTYKSKFKWRKSNRQFNSLYFISVWVVSYVINLVYIVDKHT